jgi:hypothetical protein
MLQAVMRKPGEGRTVAVVGTVYRFLATGEDANGNSQPGESAHCPLIRRRLRTRRALLRDKTSRRDGAIQRG